MKKIELLESVLLKKSGLGTFAKKIESGGENGKS